MKKIFSILIAILFVGSMMAAEVTVQKTMTEIVTANEYTVSAGNAVTCYTSFALDEKITVSTSGAANCGSFWGSPAQDWRLYQNKSGDITVTAAEGYTIKKLTITYNVSSSGTLKDGTTTIASASEQTIDAQSKTYTVGNTGTATNGQVRVTQIKVIYEAAAPEPTTKTVYCKMTYSWWTDGSAAVGAYAWKEGGEANAVWPGVKMSAVEGQMGVWTIDLDTTKYDKVIFTRLKGDGTEYWGAKTDDQLIPSDDKDLFTITSSEAQWDNDGKKAAGTWSKYVPETPAKFYIVGDSALVTDAGFAGKAWNPDAIKSETDTFTMNLKAGVDYQLKITTDGTWGTVKGYNKLTKVAAGLKDLDGDNHNIGFKLNEAGEVKVVYTDKVFELLGDFFVEIPAKFYITGDSALVTDAGAPGKAWNPDAIKSETDTFTLKNLKAGQEYILKLTLNGTWEGENNIKGYNELTEKTPGLKDVSDDHNIGFKLNEAGDVQVIYKDGETPVFKLVGNFVVEIPHYFIAGTMTNWKDEMVELLPLEEKTDSLGVALNLKADSLYLYKIVRVQGTDTAWYGLEGDATMEYGNSTGWYIYKSEGDKNQKNVGLQTTKEGDYPVTLVIKEDQLIVSVVIPKPDTKYYAKYADKAGEWNWKLLTEKEGKWLTDTIVYYGGGMNIHSAAEGDGKYFAEIAGVAEKDTAYFSFNPEDSTLVATVVGAYVVPIAEDGYYLVGTFNDWTPSAAYMFVANELKPGEFVLTTTLAVDDEFKVIKSEGGNFTWYPAEGDNFVVMACYAGEKTMYFNPIVQDGWSLLGGHLYMEYTFKPGYYLVGSMTSWLPKEQYWFGDYMLSEEYQLETVLEEGWQIKVAKLEGNGEVYEYFPDGEGTHYTVDAAHAGAVIVYFRNLGYTEWAAFGGYIYIQPKSPSDIENTTVDGAAVKILRDGQILIIKGEKTYNALGILVE